MVSETCAKWTKIFSVIMASLGTLASCLLFWIGAAQMHNVDPDEAAADSTAQQLGNFYACTDVADGLATGLSDDLQDVVRNVQCAPQAAFIFFFVMTGLWMLFTTIAVLYASFKESRGGLFCSAMFVSATMALCFVSVSFVLLEGGQTAAQLVDCEGFSTAEVTRINGDFNVLYNTVCIEGGPAGTLESGKDWLSAFAAVIAGGSIGIIADLILVGILAYVFGRTKNENDY